MRQLRVVNSEEVQGPDSFVKVRSPLWDEVKALRQVQREGDEDEALERAEEMVRECVVEWNWTDENGNPLPLPGKMERLGEMLTAEEMKFLIRAIAKKDTKN